MSPPSLPTLQNNVTDQSELSTVLTNLGTVLRSINCR